MKKPKKSLLKTFTPISAVSAVFGLAASVANAQTTPVFSYSFPASWSSGTVVTDQSVAGDTGTAGVSMKLDSANVPPGALAGTDSINTTKGHIYTSGLQSLNNNAVWAAGGFTENLWFNWGGSNSASFSGIQKLIDYAGTESLQIVTTGSGTNQPQTATLEMGFENDSLTTSYLTTSITSSNWYNVSVSFVATSETLSSNTNFPGMYDVTGNATLSVNGVVVASGVETKGAYGDSLNRPIGIGGFGYPSTTLIAFDGDIYNPNVSLGVVPEPTTLALGALGGLGMLALRRRKS